MIISHEHKFIFLKTRKTAGTSVELALSHVCGPDDIITPMSPKDEPLRAEGRGPQNWRVHGWWHSKRPLFERYWFRADAHDYGYYNHIPAKEARELLNDDKIWRSYFKFTFERNPWDRQVSAYHFRYRRSDNPPPFSSYMHRKRRAWINNYEIYSIDGDPCVDFVGKFESLTADFRKALKEIGLDSDRELPRAKANFRRSPRHYRDYYDDETRGIVNDWYAPEIRLLAYEF
jgi:hypothetical protein